MARAKNPRRILVAQLRDWKRLIGDLILFWDVTGRVVEVHSKNGRVVNHTWRDRRYDEYRENRVENWTLMAANARGLAEQCMIVARWCEDQAELARERQANR